MLERVKTKHHAEKRVLAQEIILLKHVTKMAIKQCKQMKVSTLQLTFIKEGQSIE